MSFPTELKPEHSRALAFLDYSLDLNLDIQTRVSGDIWVEGNIQLVNTPVSSRNIPSGESWRWNQTKGRRKAFLSNRNVSVVLAKLIPRRKEGVSPSVSIPSLKIWHFVLTYPNSSPIHAVWCEKGLKSHQLNTNLEEAPALHKIQLSYICN